MLELAAAMCLMNLDSPCYEVTSILDTVNDLQITSLNNDSVFTGSINDKMVICSENIVHHSVDSLNESLGFFITDSGIAAGIGSNSVLQDDKLVIVDPSGETLIENIDGSGGWASLTGINQYGSVIGNYSGGSGSSEWIAFIYTEQFGIQFINPANDGAYAFAISENNQVAGYFEYGNQLRAMTYFYGVWTDLSQELGLKGNSQARYFDENNRVFIIEYFKGYLNCMWYDQVIDTVVPVYSFPPGTYSLSTACSPSGQVAFSWTTFDGQPHLARWSDMNGFEESSLPEEILGISANALSSEGTVACTAIIKPSYHNEAFVWENNSLFPYSINNYLPNNPNTSQIITMHDAGNMIVRSGNDYFLFESHCSTDLNKDGLINVSDILLLLDAWSSSPSESCSADINQDGVVSIGDLLLIIDSWGDCI